MIAPITTRHYKNALALTRYKITRCKPFKGANILPTAEQALKCVYLCQSLTTVYRPIYMVRLDERTGKIFILAGNDIEILISRNEPGNTYDQAKL